MLCITCFHCDVAWRVDVHYLFSLWWCVEGWRTLSLKRKCFQWRTLAAVEGHPWPWCPRQGLQALCQPVRSPSSANPLWPPPNPPYASTLARVGCSSHLSSVLCVTVVWIICSVDGMASSQTCEAKLSSLWHQSYVSYFDLGSFGDWSSLKVLGKWATIYKALEAFEISHLTEVFQSSWI